MAASAGNNLSSIGGDEEVDIHIPTDIRDEFLHLLHNGSDQELLVFLEEYEDQADALLNYPLSEEGYALLVLFEQTPISLDKISVILQHPQFKLNYTYLQDFLINNSTDADAEEVITLLVEEGYKPRDGLFYVLLDCISAGNEVAFTLLRRLVNEDSEEIRAALSGRDGLVPLTHAIAYYSGEEGGIRDQILRYLLEIYLQRRIPVLEDMNGSSVMMLALPHRLPFDVLEMILDIEGMNVNIMDIQGQYPLYFAVENGWPDVVNLLLRRGAHELREPRNEVPYPPAALLDTCLARFFIAAQEDEARYLECARLLLESTQTNRISLVEHIQVSNVKMPILHVAALLHEKSSGADMRAAWDETFDRLLERVGDRAKGEEDSEGNLLIHQGAIRGSPWICRQGVRVGQSGWTPNEAGETALTLLQEWLEGGPRPGQNTVEGIREAFIIVAEGCPPPPLEGDLLEIQLRTLIVPRGQTFCVSSRASADVLKKFFKDYLYCKQPRGANYVSVKGLRYKLLVGNRVLESPAGESIGELGVVGGSTITAVVEVRSGRGGTRRLRRVERRRYGIKTQRKRIFLNA
jgi:hypothetical protein